jgi:outer membrane protein W
MFHLGVMLALVAGVSAAHAGEPTDEVTARSQRARNGAGLQFSSWQPDKPAGFRTSESIALQGYFQKGLDLHLAWENTLGYWRRTSSWTESQLLGGTTTHELQTHLVPTLTALRLYPFTTSANPVEPYVSAGLGAVLGFQQESASGSLAPPDASSMHAGLGVRAGVGVDVRANEAFGFTAGGHFESASFGQDMAGDRLYRGWGVDLGLAYRFQYR